MNKINEIPASSNADEANLPNDYLASVYVSDNWGDM